MSTRSLLIAAASALLVLGAMFIGYEIGTGREAAVGTPQALADIQASLKRLDERMRILEASGSRKAGADGAGTVAGEDEDQARARAEEPRLASLESQLSTLGERVAGLEQDPVRRGFAFLGSENPELRREGVNILRDVARFDPEARAAIRKLLHDPSPRVREQAAQVLGNFRDKEALPVLMELLGDSEASVRRRAVLGLTRLEAGDAGPAMTERLASDQDARVREAAADGLGRLKSSQASGALLKALKDPSEGVRAEAIASLGEVGAREAAPALRAMYDQDPGPDRIRLVLALKTLGDEAPLHQEVQRLSQLVEKDADPGIRRQAVRELATLARDSSQQVFSQALLDPSPIVRQEAERALRR
jgi:hypothetical protein